MVYCCGGNADARHLKRLKVLQNKAIRTVLKANYRSNINHLYLNIKCLQCEIYKSQTLLFMFKLYNGYLPRNCDKYILYV